MIAANRHTHSALVSASLRVGELEFNVAQLGNGFCILRDSAPLPPCKAELRVSVDGVEDRQPIFLDRGIDPATIRTSFRPEIG
jgi:hypothetical protein